MGRAPCCDKANVKKGPWSLEEDAKLKSYIEKHGTGGNWIALPKKIGLKRCGKSCRLRWLNYLRPNIKRGGFSEEEENIICSLYISIGSRWSIIAAQLPGRTDNDLKNYWNTSLKKKLLGKQTQKGRRKSKQNQEMRKIKDHNNYIVPSDHNNNNQNPYWQDQPQVVLPPPIPYSIEEPRFNDHASIRKLLIKLGGRFSNDDQPINSFPNHQYTPPPPPVDQLNMLSSPTPIDVLNTCLPEMAMLTTQNSYASELEQMIYNNPKIFEGLEFLCGDMMMNSRIGGGCGGSSAAGWDDQMSSNLLLPCHVTSSDFEGQQGTTLEEECSITR